MKETTFYKLEASGNDFILIARRRVVRAAKLNYKSIARHVCRRNIGIGADGLLVIENSKKQELEFQIKEKRKV